MSVKLPNGMISRSMPEQVGKNTRDIEELKTGYNQISNIAIVEGHLIVTLQDGSEFDTGTIKGIDTIAFNGSKHLIVTYDDGTSVDLGLIKGISSMSINSSQHLIVSYDNGTTEDLGAIFSGNVNISGNLTADSIIENMSGYSFTPKTPSTFALVYNYVGVCNNGNKVTIVMSCLFTPSSGSSGFQEIGRINMPSSVLDKIIPAPAPVQDSVDIQSVEAFNSVTSSSSIKFRTTKGYNYLAVATHPTGLTNGTTYFVRYEATFLLSTNLAS